MKNKEIASILDSIADMLEILGENSFKVIAYQRASRLVDMQSAELSEVYKKHGIQGITKIRGIGEGIAEKIEDLLINSQSKYYLTLRKKVPDPILKFIKIPGVGPKTAKKLYDVFKVNSLNKLKQQLIGEKHLDKFHHKTRENIIRGIGILNSQTGRMLLPRALQIARKIITKLEKYSQIKQTNYVGSLRRMQETIGDIDIVASFDAKKNDSNQIIDQFIHEEFVSQVVGHGQAKATIITKDSVHVDLEILPYEQYGSLLQHFTGDKDHNTALRAYARKIGYSVSEHGIINTKTSKLIKCSTEEKVYSSLKMQTPVPEIRNNSGEIEAGLKHSLPKLISLKDIKGDLQMHTIYSDGKNTIAQMAKVCKKLGYEYLAISDHPATLGITHGLKASDINNYLKDIKLAEQQEKIHIFSAIEANIKPDGQIDLLDTYLKKFDIVLAAVHSSFRQTTEIATQRLIKAMKHPLVKIIAHPTGRIIEQRPGLNYDWSQIWQASKDSRTILEIDAYPDRLDLSDKNIRLAAKNNVKLVIDTDSHSDKHLVNMKFGLAQARRGWVQANDVINTYSYQKIKKVLNISKKT